MDDDADYEDEDEEEDDDDDDEDEDEDGEDEEDDDDDDDDDGMVRTLDMRWGRAPGWIGRSMDAVVPVEPPGKTTTTRICVGGVRGRR